MNLLEFIRTTFLLGGGPGRTIALIINVLRNEGWSGIRWRLGNARKLSESGTAQTLVDPDHSTSCLGIAELVKLAVAPSILGRKIDADTYSEWVKSYDTLTDVDHDAIRSHSLTLEQRPLISVVMAIFDPRIGWLEDAIESVQMQLYDNWELCIVDDASGNPEVRRLLAEFVSRDPRIKLALRDGNKHTPNDFNNALELASGQWVTFLGHEDLLAESALFWVAKAINEKTDAALIYSDEDRVNKAGIRLDPHFKPDWNYDLLLSYDYVSHLCVIRRELVCKLGGFRPNYGGAQGYDLTLRCVEVLRPDQIAHIPRVLYHGRVHPENIANSRQSQAYAIADGLRVIQDHLERQGIAAEARYIATGYYEVTYALPSPPSPSPSPCPLVSLIIPTRNGHDLIKMCVDSIRQLTDYPNYEILVVDNGSDDPVTLSYFRELELDTRIRVVRDDRPFNYSALNNAAVIRARGEFVALVNNDIEVTEPGWLTELVSTAIQPGVGVVGAKLLYPDSTIQHAGVIVGFGGVAGHSHKYFPGEHPGYFFRIAAKQSLSAVTAACMLVRKSIYLEVGGLDEQNLAVSFNDVDFCLRVRDAGYRNVYAPRAELIHHESASRGDDDTPEKQARFERELHYMKSLWGNALLCDPAYSPNLTLIREDFSLAWPPRVPKLP